MSTRKRSADSAFTLLEVLVVLVILALAGTIVGLSAPNAQLRVKLAEAETILDATLAQARTEARRTGEPRFVIFDLDRQRISQQGLIKWANFPPGVELSVTTARELGSPRQPVIAYLPDGTSSGGEIIIEVETARRIRRIEWLTGQVRDSLHD